MKATLKVPVSSSLPKCAEARQRPAARRERNPDHDLVGARRVGDPHFERLVVRADAVVVIVLDRDVDRRTGGAALLGGGEQRRPVDGVADTIAEAEVVDDRRAVLDLAVEPDERALAVPLRLRTEQLERPLCQQRASGSQYWSISGSRSSTYRPANGFTTTAPAAAMRTGGSTSRPPSRWTSSTTVTTLRRPCIGQG